MTVQLELFEDNDEVSLMRKEISLIKQSQDNVRKGLFSRMNELSKLYIQLKEDNEKIRRLLIERKK